MTATDPDSKDERSALSHAKDDGSGEAPAAEEARDAARMTKKSYVTILEQEIEEGSRELKRRAAGLFLSGLSAGLDVGLSALVLGVIVTASKGNVSPPILLLLKANAYTLGFIVVIFGRSELFTEHTTLAVLPVLARRASPLRLARLWSIVYVANLLGAALFAALLANLGPALGVVSLETLHELATHTVEPTSTTLFFSALVAGWLMGLVSWLVTAGRDTVGQIIFVWLVTGAIGLCSLHHCIVGSVEVLAGVYTSPDVTLVDFLRFLGFSTLGNVVGGTVFVALLKFGHARVPVDVPRWQRPPREQ